MKMTTNRKSSRQTTKVEKFVVRSDSGQSSKRSDSSHLKDDVEPSKDDTKPAIKCFPAKPGAKCAICRTDQVDEMLLGEFLSCIEIPSSGKQLDEVETTESVISVHYACLLTACNLCQQVDEDLELRGFTVASVRKEVRRCAPEVCVFCKKKGAVVGCCLKRCKRMFHFPCALENGVITEFFGVYNSWCDNHAQPQSIPEQPKDACCPICADEFENRPLFHCECCSNVLHMDCLRPYVFNAGTYYLKCPFCQDVDKFKDLIDRYCGIHIPTREPTYEDHDRMVVELVCAYEFCPDPDKCVDDEDWRLIKCIICGGRAMHVMCVAKAFVHQRFVCPDCGDNDSYESAYRVLARMGSGTEVGRMFPWQFFSLTQLVHSIKIPHCDEDGNLTNGKTGSGSNEDNQPRSTRKGSTNQSVTKSKRKPRRAKETEEVEICFEKRGTKEILGEIDFSSDEEPAPEDDQPTERQRSAELENGMNADAEMETVEDSNHIELPKTNESKSRKRRKPKKELFSKRKKSELKHNSTVVEDNSAEKAPSIEMKAKQGSVEKSESSKSSKNNLTNSIKPNDTSSDKFSSKENRKPEEMSSCGRGTHSKKPKCEEPILLSSDSSDDSLDDESTELPYEIITPKLSTQTGYKPCCGPKVDFLLAKEATRPNSVTFKRPVRDGGAMRHVVIGGPTSMNMNQTNGAETSFSPNSPTGDIENQHNSLNRGAHHFHFQSGNSSSSLNKSSLLSTASSVGTKSIPLSVNTNHVAHNLRSPLSVDASQRMLRASPRPRGSKILDPSQFLHTC